MALRTFVIADAHGHPEIIRSALDHGGFAPDRDRFVFAGDFLDRGTDPQGCLELIERQATEVLLGNHDLAALLDVFIWPQEPESASYRPLLIDKVLNKDPRYAWKAVTAVEGVLVSHAGISTRYEKPFRETCHQEPAVFAEYLNEAFRTAVRRRLEMEGGGAAATAGARLGAQSDGAWPKTAEHEAAEPEAAEPNGAKSGVEDDPVDEGTLGDDLLDDDGPFWFRPPPFSYSRPLAGVMQVAGHSPPVEELAEAGFYMIDPAVWLAALGDPLRFRYAVIEGGRVRVEEGPVTEANSRRKRR